MRLAAFLTRPTRCPIYRLPLPRLTPLPLTRRHDPFDDLDWLFELKLDGFRALAYVERGQGRLVSRNGNTFKRFTPLAAEIGVALRGVRNAILDGEVICLDGTARPLFDALLYRRGARGARGPDPAKVSTPSARYQRRESARGAKRGQG